MTRILIVDDEEGIRRSLAGILGDEGFESTSAADGEQALESIATDGVPDCIEVQVTGLQGSVLTDIDLIPVTGADCHPECDDNGEDCDTSGWER